MCAISTEWMKGKRGDADARITEQQVYIIMNGPYAKGNLMSE